MRPNSQQHGQKLQRELEQAKQDSEILAQSWEGREDVRARGLIIELESAPDVEIDVSKLEEGGWVLLNEKVQATQTQQLVTFQRWFVPEGKLPLIEKLLRDYLTRTRRTQGGTQPLGRPFVDAIERIGKAAARELWTEPNEDFPEEETLWFEVWLRAGGSTSERNLIVDQFTTLARRVALKPGEQRIELPEHTIIAAHGLGRAFSQDLALLNCVAEIRRIHDYADFFEALRPEEQTAWVADLRGRINRAPDPAPHVTLLDTGINRAHPLLESLIPTTSNLTINPNWSAADDDNHGTMMAGLCLFGNLTTPLAANSHG